jgi:hypothetical protein
MPTRFAIFLLVIFALPFGISGQRKTLHAAGQTAPIPRDCEKRDLLARGRPTMVSMRKSLAFGLSLAKREFKAGEPITLHVWVDNTGNKPAGVMTCSGLGYFKDRGFDVYAAGGHRILRRFEVKMQDECKNDLDKRQYPDDLWICGREFPIYIPSHTCVTRDDFDFTVVLTDEFDLPPGSTLFASATIRLSLEIPVCRRRSKLPQRRLAPL